MSEVENSPTTATLIEEETKENRKDQTSVKVLFKFKYFLYINI